ncbi:MAG: RAMP superfamily CRISPR-associated protein [Cyanobacteria bacterium J06621_15]
MVYLDNLSSKGTKRIELTAIIDTALCVGAGGSTGSLADKPIVRNAQGQLLIPGSQLKGRLRHECEKLARGLGWTIFSAPLPKTLSPTTAEVETKFQDKYTVPGYRGYHCLVSQIFGDPILPSRILVDDLICSIPATDLEEILRPSVTINRRRRTSDEKKLFFLETSPPNAQLKFTGEIYLLPKSPEYSQALILAALQHINALGGSKSAGLGWLTWEVDAKAFKDNFEWSKLLPE